MENKIHFLISEDFLPWEREVLSSIELCFPNFEHTVESFKEARPHKVKAEGSVWVLSPRWHEVVKKFDFSRSKKVVVSTLGFPSGATSFLAMLFWGKLKFKVSSKFHFVAHSPFAFRFLREIRGVPEAQVTHLPFPYQGMENSAYDGGAPHVGIPTRFLSESNLNYALTIAHYVRERLPSVRFTFIGKGSLRAHLERSIAELEMGSTVFVADAIPHDLSIVLFVPLQNEHFFPVSFAAARKLPFLSSEVPGIEKLITDGKDGFLVPVHETKPMAELILRLLKDSYLAQAMGGGLHTAMKEKFSGNVLAPLYEQVVLGTVPENIVVSKAA